MKLQVILSLCSLTCFAESLFVSRTNASFVFDTLENMRDQIVLPKYTVKEKVTMAKQIETLFDVYVNRESKIENYGLEADPIPRIKR